MCVLKLNLVITEISNPFPQYWSLASACNIEPLYRCQDHQLGEERAKLSEVVIMTMITVTKEIAEALKDPGSKMTGTEGTGEEIAAMGGTMTSVGIIEGDMMIQTDTMKAPDMQETAVSGFSHLSC